MQNTTIIVAKSTRDLLRDLGKKQETYNDIVNRLIMLAKEQPLNNHR
jgi:hypothetical protein